ncbi:MAG: hypothetical protein WAL40_18550, partial [Rhodoplanes sp.]
TAIGFWRRRGGWDRRSGRERRVPAVVMQRSDNILGVLKSPTTQGSATFDLRPGAEKEWT